MVRTTVIAEAGVNHNGDLQLARGLVDAAAAAGADFVKFQTFTADALVTRAASKADYQKKNTGMEETQYEMLKALELNLEAHHALVAYSNERGIRFFSTAFDLTSLALLHELKLGLYKVPSGEITNLPYLREIGSRNSRVLLSTGMSNLADVEAALAVLCEAGTSRDKITVLHCNTQYPTPMVDVNLRAMVNMGKAFGVAFGYSDHTAGIEVPVAAVALGATVIEKHLTLDRTLPGPDHVASLEPGEFKAMVSAIRNIETALGDGIKRPTASEAPNVAVARKSICAARDIRRGEVFGADNLTVKRPGNGLSPMQWNDVVGRTAGRDFSADEQIEL